MHKSHKHHYTVQEQKAKKKNLAGIESKTYHTHTFNGVLPVGNGDGGVDHLEGLLEQQCVPHVVRHDACQIINGAAGSETSALDERERFAETRLSHKCASLTPGQLPYQAALHLLQV